MEMALSHFEGLCKEIFAMRMLLEVRTCCVGTNLGHAWPLATVPSKFSKAVDSRYVPLLRQNGDLGLYI